MRKLIIPINCGENTCAKEPGVFCSYVGTRSFGTKFVCMLFGEKLWDNENGWLQRCEACLKYDKGGDNND